MLELQINKLIASDHEICEKLGWLLYDREDEGNGLTEGELHRLLEIVTDEAVESVYEKGHSDGFDYGLERG